MRVLFLSDCNGHEHTDPKVWLVDVYKTEIRIMRALEDSQLGVCMMGGCWT